VFICRESEARCPVDNQPLEEKQLFPDNFAKREILALSVKCPNHKEGCDKNVILNYLHVSLSWYNVSDAGISGVGARYPLSYVS